jgi:polyisoprenoid-binding protein YceI
MTAAMTIIPGYVVGTWNIDPVHSEVTFTVRHLMVSKIRGKFTEFTGNIVTAENVLDSHAEGEVEMASIDTGTKMRDDDLRSSNFFDVATHPKMTFTSTGLRPDGGTSCSTVSSPSVASPSPWPSNWSSVGSARIRMAAPVRASARRPISTGPTSA